mmetsp:Transcript_6592/g.9191  ORF Transcript_6592/g.9191 Transcript_6592/m.9191 type:complete len:84 (-) Transcript_6592:169-420(-)
MNAFVTQLEHRIARLPPVPQIDENGNIIGAPALPNNYPDTKQHLLALTNAAIAPILAIYQLPIQGTLQQKKRTLAIYLGLPAL